MRGVWAWRMGRVNSGRSITPMPRGATTGTTAQGCLNTDQTYLVVFESDEAIVADASGQVEISLELVVTNDFSLLRSRLLPRF